MNKKILIIGNTRGECGVSKDIKAYKDFFTSAQGGYWREDEIDTLTDIKTSTFKIHKAWCQMQKYDYFVLIFTGHGGFSRQRNETVLELSDNNDVYERDILNIAEKQLTILDCCRSYYAEPIELVCNKSAGMTMTTRNDEIIRAIYEEKIKQSPNFQYRLYACSESETAEGSTQTGGAFTSCLLRATKDCLSASNTVTINKAFERTRMYMAANKALDKLAQTPEAKLPKCLSSQNLVWAINPHAFFTHGFVGRSWVSPF